MKLHSTTILLMILSACIIFASWISQNQFRSKWLDNRIYLENTQVLVQIEQNNASFWMAQLNLEQVRKPRNDDLLLSAAYNYIHSVITIFAWENSRVSGGASKPIEEKNLTEAYAKMLYDSKDLNGLMDLAFSATRIKAKHQDRLNNSFGEQLNDSRYKSAKWNSRFMWFYIAGSVLFGLRWLLISILHWPNKYMKHATAQE